MSGAASAPSEPDLSGGVDMAILPEDGMLLGHVGGEPALLVRHLGECFAIGAVCTHYGGPLRVSWPRAPSAVPGITPASACAPGAVRPPALAPVARWGIARNGNSVFARERLQPAAPLRHGMSSFGRQERAFLASRVVMQVGLR